MKGQGSMSQQSPQRGNLTETGRRARRQFFAKQGAISKARAATARRIATDPIAAGWTAIAHRADTTNGLTRHRAWTLYHQSDKGGWHNFVLRHNDEHFRKFSFWGAWNGQRFARNKDLAQLHDKHPRIYAWLEARCRRKWINGEPDE
jgi:hypothetical protein